MKFELYKDMRQFVFAFLRREKDARPFRRKFLALLQSADDFVALFVVFNTMS